MNPIKNILNWYFSRNSLPYWCILLIDCLIVCLSGVIVSWLSYHTQTMVNLRHEIVNTLLLYMALSIVGFKIFHTYSGIMRYSSFVDLQKIAFANFISMMIAYVIQYFGDLLPAGTFALFSGRMLISMFLMATLMMWGVRIIVKVLYDVSYTSDRAINVLVYGVKDGGVGLAKSIRNQKPSKYGSSPNCVGSVF